MLILGCGWAGILAASRWGGLCLDKNVELGGLLRSVIIDGFTVDIGGTHIIYSRDKSVLNEMLDLLGDNVISHERRSYVLLDKLFVPYPLENGLYVLPPEERAEALITFIEAMLSMGKDWRLRSFEDWILSFGKWIAEKYLIPYNKKIWKRPLSEIDVDWVYTPGRLPVPDWKTVTRAAVGIPTTGYTEQTRFYYPLKGGIQALYDAAKQRALSKGTALRGGEPVESIKIGDEILVNDKYRARKAVSTIPLPELINSIEGKPRDDLEEFTRRFDYNSVAIIAVAVARDAPSMHWIYVPDENIIFHRYIWVSNYSPYNAPRGKSLLLAEVTIPPWQSIDEKLVDRVVKDLSRLGVVEEKDILFTKMWFHKYGYPIHRIGLAEIRGFITNYLKELGITLAGRWGTWRYLNMDMVLKQVKELKVA